MSLLMPGLFLSMILSGNVHAFSISIAAAFNICLYTLLGWLCNRLFNRRKPPVA
jgi:hypothetical protein